ncbi:MAG: PDDEXK nuclease domain-containing protein [Cellvibrio sp.]|uniref:PDDEXK nuclease domain-containing protein n=1 Tax=Cellvibrio sp. TaxID=1965322 RepID=UPI0031AD6DCA
MADTIIKTNLEYKDWLKGIKQSFLQTQLKAAISVNTALLEFYWQLGGEIVEKQKSAQWGDGFLAQLSHDLIAEFPDIKGFSKRNLEQIRQWCRYWTADSSIALQAVAQLVQIPWGHNLIIISKCPNHVEALFYVQNTLKHGWSRNVLVHQIESGLYQRDAKAITNFEQTLPPLQSDLALQTLKDPYIFDFLNLTHDYNERELEQALTQHITQFLLELGAGFAYVGKQVPLTVASKDFYLDLLFYHLKLRSYVVIELKSGDFTPEHTGKLNFYLTAIDKQLKTEHDNPSIGLLLCKQKDKLVAEYALCDIHKPIGISAYQLTQALPENLKSSLPSIEEIEAEFAQPLPDRNVR